MKQITIDELRNMTAAEGLILQGCGGDLREWSDGINEMLTDEQILQNGDTFKDVRAFEHNGLTNLFFDMENVDLNVGKLAMWRLATHDTFGGTWPLNMSDEVSELELSNDGFDLTYYLDYCENLDEKHCPSRKPIIKLADMLSCNFEDVHLCHKEVENEPVTICELNNSTLTTEGKQEWADVLKADVCRIYDGYYGLQIELLGVKPSRLDAFSGMLAGICSQENYEKWVMQEQESPMAMTMKQE